MNGDELARPKTKHISSACGVCRKKKIKCDGVAPRCSNCVLYDQECVYQPTADKRKVLRKDRTAALEARIELLESLLHANGIAVPTSPGLENNFEPSIIKPESQSNDLGQIDIPTQKATLAHSGADESLVDQLSGRMGSLQLADDGQLRFYGPTSNLTILQNGPLSMSPGGHRSVAREWQQILSDASLGHFIDPQLEDHLLKLYFCWEDPSIHVVEESIFFREMARCRSSSVTSAMYSEVLTNAMCSVGASLTERRYNDLPVPLTEFFAKRARALLDVEMDSPTLSTVQSLVILSAVEAFMVRDARGWLYSGMAVRLATDLGLHIDPQSFVDTGLITEEEASVRNTIFWGTFVHDRMWSLYVGRPCALESKHITLKHPDGDMLGGISKLWHPYIDDQIDLGTPSLLDPAKDVARANVLLCAKMQNIRETLYNNKKTQANEIATIRKFVGQMSGELRHWHAALPDTLIVDYQDSSSYYLPHVLQLHMQYQCIMILVNRPFLSSGDSSRDACLDAASAIASLLRIFDRLYTMRRINVQAVHLIFTASMIHAVSACGLDPGSDTSMASADLETCCHALRTMGTQFKSAIRAHEVIIYLKMKLLERKRTHAKRSQPPSDHTQEATTTKRARPSFHATMSENLAGPLLNGWNFIGIDGTAVAGNMNDDVQLDSLFWSDFTTIDSTNNFSWHENG